MLDKWGTGWYSIEAVRQDGPAERRCVQKQIEKDLKKALDNLKNLKKVLDKGETRW